MDDELSKPHRTTTNWLILLAVWAVGLVIWSGYLAGLAALFALLFLQRAS